jgi:UDPglucose 6-dehydrogenase
MEINKEFKVGIVGQGFVGSAVKAGFEHVTTVLTYDKFQTQKSNSTLENLVENCEIIFVCIPTPMVLETGESYTGFVEEVVVGVEEIVRELHREKRITHKPILVVKSTIPPGTSERLNSRMLLSNIAFNPEFLTEANAINDFMFQDRIVLGATDYQDISKLVELYKYAFPNATIFETTATNAEMIKYVANCFLSVKVSFANEMYDLCQSVGADYDEVINGAKLDKRLGASHWQVPGPDGDRGFGGHCFPKDMEALKFVARDAGINLNVVEAAVKTNNRIRKNRDWEQQVGRAVISSKIEKI